MIDGITIKCKIKDFNKWIEVVKPSLAQYVGSFGDCDLKSKKRENKSITTHRGKFETYDLIVKEVEDFTNKSACHYLSVRGSFHKNHYNGHNYKPFSFEQLCTQVQHVSNSLSIPPQTVQVSAIEVGLNISTPFEVTPYLMQNIIAYKGHQFNTYKPGKDGKRLGIYCDLSQYTVKIYNKGLQYNQPNNLLRFELKFSKMQPVNKVGVRTLHDLLNIEVYECLKSLLLQAWDNVLVYDVSVPVNSLPINTKERELLRNGRNPKFWEKLKRCADHNAYKYTVGKFKKLVSIHGLNTSKTVSDLLNKEWETACKNYPNLPCGKNEELPKFTIKIKCKNGENGFSPLIRHCKSCGKELHPEQKPDSLFCSAKYVGYDAAHKCRNMDSNKRNNFRSKIKRIESRGVLFNIEPFFVQRV